MPEATVTIEVIGEGKADVGQPGETILPEKGVVPILLHKLCGKPAAMRIRPQRIAQLQKGNRSRKVRFAKTQARVNKSDALVFVIDSEGDYKEFNRKTGELRKGRDAEPSDFPTAIGVAQPCIEAWLLADAPAIRMGMDLPGTPDVPDAPEKLPGPPVDEKKSPKGVLAKLVRSRHKECSSNDKNKIARAMNDMELVRKRCPLSFAPFADEVNQHIRPLF